MARSKITTPAPTEIGSVINEMIGLRLRKHYEVMEAATMLCLKLNCGMRVHVGLLRTDVRLDPDLPFGEVVEQWDTQITGTTDDANSPT